MTPRIERLVRHLEAAAFVTFILILGATSITVLVSLILSTQ